MTAGKEREPRYGLRDERLCSWEEEAWGWAGAGGAGQTRTDGN